MEERLRRRACREGFYGVLELGDILEVCAQVGLGNSFVAVELGAEDRRGGRRDASCQLETVKLGIDVADLAGEWSVEL